MSNNSIAENRWLQHPEMVARLKQLYAKDCSARQIADALNQQFGEHFSRNAIIGKIGRLRLKRQLSMQPPRPKSEKPKVSRQTPQLANPASEARVRALLDMADRLASDAPVELPPDRSDCPVAFMDLRRRHCRWPIDQPDGSILYCGAEHISGSSYCRRHHRIAYRAAERRTA